MQQNKLTVKC